MAITPLTREFIRCGREAFQPSPDGKEKAMPALASHVFWNAAIIMNLANLPSLFSKAALAPVAMTAMNLVTLAAGVWAWRRLQRAEQQSRLAQEISG